MKNKLKLLIFICSLLFFPLVSFAAEQVFFYHTDPAGTPLAMTNASGSVVWKADYKPFGEENTVTSSQENNKKFVGKEKDEETGLYYFGARYMEAKIGRFVSVDPAGITEKDLLNPQRLNRYAYGLNNPLKYVDENGRWPEEVHNAILKETFSGDYAMPEKVIAIFMQASAYVDEPQFQDTGHSHMHAMSAPSQTPEEAENFITGKVNDYKRLMAEGKTDEAYFALGEAMHSLMDSTSPAHEGFQVWEGLNGPIKLIKAGLHGLQESEREFNSNPEYLRRTVDLLRKFYDANR